MKKKTVFLIALLLPILVFASEEAHEGTDIVSRTINFLIFAAILYYLIAKPIREFFANRRDEIATRLESVQKKVQETKSLKEEALKELEEAKANAKSLVETAHKEVELLSEKYEKDLESELKNLEKGYEERMEIEKRKSIRNSVSEILNELFKEGGIKLDENSLVKILLKKAA